MTGENTAIEDYLIEREVEPSTFPNKVYAVGGAGKQIAYQIFEQDWFVVEAVRPDEREGDNIDVHILDTATENRQTDRQTVKRLNEKAKSVVSDVQRNEEVMGDARDLTVDARFLTENIFNDQVADFIGDRVIKQVLEDTDANFWWINENHVLSPTSPGDMFNFSQGVIRRRAVGKALFYKALAEDTTFTEVFDLSGGGSAQEIALFAGLGGGTGSGIAIDIAKQLRENADDARITLFATVPNTEEESNERANAFAALGELEYLNLHPELDNPFNDIVIIPLNPTDHGGGETDTQELRELDEALAYTLLTYYNNSDVDEPFKGATAFAPFTLAVPQVLRYDVQVLNRAREVGYRLLDHKRSALEYERYIYNNLEEYIEQQFPAETYRPGSQELNAEERERIIERIREFKRLVTSPVFEQVEYEAITRGKAALENIYNLDDFDRHDPEELDVRNVVEEEGIDDVMESIRFELESSAQEPGNLGQFEELADQALERVFIEDLLNIRQLYELFHARKRIPEELDVITRLIGVFLNPEADRHGEVQNRWGRLTTRLDQKEERVEELRAEESELQNELQEAKEQHEERVDELYEEWFEAVRNDLDALRDLRDVDINSKLRVLTNELEDITTDLRTASPDEITHQVDDILDDIESALADTPVDFTEERAEIDRSVQNLIRARRTWLEIEEQETTDGGLLPKFGGPSSADEERQTWSGIRNDLSNRDVYRIGTLPDNLENKSFIAEVEYHPYRDGRVGQRLKDERETAEQAVLERFRKELEPLVQSIEVVDEEEAQLADELDSFVSGTSTQDDIRELVKHVFRRHFDANIAELERELSEVTDTRQHEEQKLEALEIASEDVWQGVRRYHGEYSEAYASYMDKMEKARSVVTSEKPSGSQLNANYIHRLDPLYKQAVKNQQSLATSELLTENDEQRRLERLLNGVAKDRIVKTRYNGLLTKRLSTKDQVYGYTRVTVGIMTPALDEGSNVPGRLETSLFRPRYKDIIEDEFRLEGDGYAQWHIQNGGPWDIGICAFIQGITFLDNFVDVVHGNQSYEDAYQDKVVGTEEAILRHALGLDQGFYVHRHETKNPKSDIEFFLSPTDERDFEERFSELTHQKYINGENGRPEPVSDRDQPAAGRRDEEQQADGTTERVSRDAGDQPPPSDEPGQETHETDTSTDNL